MSHITSSANPKIKEAAKLRDGKHRRRTGLFLIEGLREVQRAIAAEVEILEIFAVEKSYERFDAKVDCSVHFVSESVFAKISFGDRLDGVVAVAKRPECSLEQFGRKIFGSRAKDAESPLLAVLEGIEKPGNVGAIFRSADGAGLDGVLIADERSDIYNPHTIRNSLGTVFRLPAAEDDSVVISQWLKNRGVHIVAARCEGAMPYTDYDFRKPTAIILGSEANGLTDTWTGDGVTVIMLPMLGIADSLNVSVAAAVLFYEARRQRD